MLKPVPYPQKLRQSFQIGFIDFLGIQQQRHDNVFAGGQDRNQIKVLKNIPELLPSDFCKSVIIDSVDIDSLDLDIAGRGMFYAADEIQKRGFPRAGLPDNCDKFPFFYTEADMVYSIDLVCSLLIYLCQILYCNNVHKVLPIFFPPFVICPRSHNAGLIARGNKCVYFTAFAVFFSACDVPDTDMRRR